MRVSGEGARRPRGRVWAALFALVLAIPTLAAAPAQKYVFDRAAIIPPVAESRLEKELAALERRTHHQLVVATTPSLDRKPILEYSVDLARRWRIGRKRFDDGVLLLVAPKEHKIRIEVGYGLEATLTDSRCAAIIRDLMLPAFAKGDLPGGISAGTRAVIARLDAAAPLEMAKR